MNDPFDSSWSRLAAAARRAPAASVRGVESCGAPPGFATRIVARARPGASGGLLGGFLFERLAARALGLAGACALVMFVWSGLSMSIEAGKKSDVSLASDAYLDPVGAIMEAEQS